MDDWELLQAYVQDGSESAFQRLVERYVDQVHSMALRQMLVQFVALAPASFTATVSFEDNPVARETSDSLANALNTAYTSGTISVTPSPGPPLRLTRSGSSLLISWPSSAKGFELEATAGALGTAWSPVQGVIDLGEQQLAIVNATGAQRYFRLRKQ